MTVNTLQTKITYKIKVTCYQNLDILPHYEIQIETPYALTN